MNTHHRITPDNAAMLLIDHQEGFLHAPLSVPGPELRNNVAGLAEVARAVGMPTVLTTSFSQGVNGPLIREITDVFPDLDVINRHLVNAWEDPDYVAAVERTGRRKLVMSALTTDVCLVFPAVSAVRAGYEVYAVLDCSAAWSKRAEDACVLRMGDAGVVMTSWVSVAAELLHDHLGPHKQPIQRVFDRRLMGYDESARERAAA